MKNKIQQFLLVTSMLFGVVSCSSDELKQYRLSAIEELSNYLDLSLYRENEKNKIQSYIDEFSSKLNKTKSESDVDSLLITYKSYLDNVMTSREILLDDLDKNQITPIMSKYIEEGYEPIYSDLAFHDPIVVSKTNQVSKPYYYTDTPIDAYKTGKDSSWEIAQWGSNYDLIGDSETDGYTLDVDEENLSYTITSKGKMVNDEFVPAKKVTFNGKDGSFYLESNCSVEYDSPRGTNDPWVHLLVQDSFGKEDIYNIANKDSIILDMEYTIDKFEDHMNGATGPYAAQIVYYLLVYNWGEPRETNPDYGQAIWFGLSIWDNRNMGEPMSPYINLDPGTGTLIYSISTNEYYTDYKGCTPMPGESRKFAIDIKQYLQQAFLGARERGYFPNSTFDQLYFGHTNFGFEMPGTYDLGVSFDHVCLFGI